MDEDLRSRMFDLYLEGVHLEFKKISSYEEYVNLRVYGKVLSELVRVTEKDLKLCLKNYTIDNLSSKQQLKDLLNIKSLEDFFNFYSRELEVVVCMLDEFSSYLTNLSFKERVQIIKGTSRV